MKLSTLTLLSLISFSALPNNNVEYSSVLEITTYQVFAESLGEIFPAANCNLYRFRRIYSCRRCSKGKTYLPILINI